MVIFGGYEDFIDEFVHKFFGNCSGGGGLLHAAHGGLHGLDLLAELLLGIHLLFQILDGGVGIGDLLGALLVHGDEVLVGDGSRDVVFQQLGLLLLGQFLPLALFLDEPGQLVIGVQGLIAFRVFGDEGLGADPGIPCHIQDQGLDLLFVDGEGGAGVGAVLDLAGADPAAVPVALLVFGLPAVVGRTAAGAVELAGEQVGVIADALPGFDIVTAPLQDGVTKVFPINPKPLSNDTLQEVKTLRQKIEKSRKTNLNTFIDYCLGLLP